MNIETFKALLEIFPEDYTVYASILKPVPDGETSSQISGVEADHDNKRIVVR